MTVEFDPNKAADNFRKHGVTFAHAEQVLRDPNGVTVADPDAQDELRWVTLGLDTLGRVLVVVHTARAGRTRVVSARKASNGEVKQYAQGI